MTRRQKHRCLGDLVRLRHTSERDRARHLDDFRLAAAIPRLGRVRKPGRDRIDPDAIGASSNAIARVSDRTPPLLAT